MSNRALLLSACSLYLVGFPAVACTGTATGTDEGSAHQSTVAPKCNPSSREISGSCPTGIKELARNIARDQAFLWLKPLRMKRGDVPWTAALAGTAAGLIAIDRPVAQELSDAPPGTGFAFSRRVGQLGGKIPTLGVAGTFLLVGRWRDDERARHTGLLGLRALADSMIVVEVLKTATGRPRPTFIGGRSRIHNADGAFFTGGRSFPSGHAAGAWALATVVAHQYQHRGWVPPTAYGLAGLIAVARITERRHFPADAFVGSVLGYLIGRHVYHVAHCKRRDSRRSWRLLPSHPPGGGVAVTLAWEF